MTITLSCTYKTKFSEEDYDWIDVYQKGDTLIFQEISSKKRDTSVISRKDVYVADFQPMASGLSRDHTCHIYYVNNKYTKIGLGEVQMLEMYKSSNWKTAFPWINYLGISINVSKSDLHTHEVILSNGTRFSEVYIFSNDRTQNHENPKRLFWDVNRGILKYEMDNGEIWERINFN